MAPQSPLKESLKRVARRPVQGFFRQLHGCGTYDSLILKSAGAPSACGPSELYLGIGEELSSLATQRTDVRTFEYTRTFAAQRCSGLARRSTRLG